LNDFLLPLRGSFEILDAFKGFEKFILRLGITLLGNLFVIFLTNVFGISSLEKKTDHGKFTSLAPQKRTWQRNITIFIIGDTSSKWLVSHCHLDNFPGFFHLSKVPKRPGHQPKNENTTQSTPKTRFKGSGGHPGSKNLIRKRMWIRPPPARWGRYR